MGVNQEQVPSAGPQEAAPTGPEPGETPSRRSKIDPSVLRKYAVLRVLHKFFWERWYIDRFYYWFFVGGIVKLYTRVPKWVEDPLDRAFHKKLPDLFTKKANHWVRVLRTESREALVRIAYVLLFLVLCILTLFWRMN